MDPGDSYRAEFRSTSGQIRGIYSWINPDGSPHTLTYNLGHRDEGQLTKAVNPFFYRFFSNNRGVN
jgi:hypothetical protein